MTEHRFSDAVGHHTLDVIAKAGRFNRWMYETIKPYLKGDILEIGSGIGNISKYVLADGYSLTLSDYDSDYCHYLKNNFSAVQNMKDVVSIDLQHDDFYNKYKSLAQRFDTVYLLNVLEHLADAEKAIAYCHFLLKPQGYLIILVPAYRFLYCRLDAELHHYKRYTMKELTQLALWQNLRLIHKQYFNALGIAGWLLYGKLLGRKTLQDTEMGRYNALVPVAKILDTVLGKKMGLSLITVSQKEQHA